jgi:ABC-type nitrate/sulfonate/bicarbonate transport system permease component
MSGDGLLARWLPPLLVLAALIGLWQIAADRGWLADVLDLDPLLVPSPSEIATALWENRQLLLDNAWVTLKEALGGFAIALALGTATAVLLHLSPFVRRALYPLVLVSQTLPIIVVAPIFAVWFGFGIWPKVALVALWCYFPIAIAAVGGLRSAPPEQGRLMRSLGAGRLRALWSFELPAALPALMAGARIAIVIAVVGAVFGEWAGAQDGLGVLMLRDNASIQVPRLFASVVVLSAMALLLFALVALVERRFVWWSSAPAPPRWRRA